MLTCESSPLEGKAVEGELMISTGENESDGDSSSAPPIESSSTSEASSARPPFSPMGRCDDDTSSSSTKVPALFLPREQKEEEEEKKQQDDDNLVTTALRDDSDDDDHHLDGDDEVALNGDEIPRLAAEESSSQKNHIEREEKEKISSDCAPATANHVFDHANLPYSSSIDQELPRSPLQQQDQDMSPASQITDNDSTKSSPPLTMDSPSWRLHQLELVTMLKAGRETAASAPPNPSYHTENCKDLDGSHQPDNLSKPLDSSRQAVRRHGKLKQAPGAYRYVPRQKSSPDQHQATEQGASSSSSPTSSRKDQYSALFDLESALVSGQLARVQVLAKPFHPLAGKFTVHHVNGAFLDQQQQEEDLRDDDHVDEERSSPEGLASHELPEQGEENLELGHEQVLVAAPVADEAETQVDEFRPPLGIPLADPYDESSFCSSAALTKRKTNRVRVLTIFIFFVVLAGCTVILIPVVAHKKRSKANPLPPTHDGSRSSSRESWVGEAIRNAIGEDLMHDPQSPYARALDWFMNVDPLDLPVSVSFNRLFQRYLLAYLYLATSAKRPWAFCSPPSKLDPGVDCTWSKLTNTQPLRINSKYNVPQQLPERGDLPGVKWLSARTECEWAGVRCSDGSEVTGLDLVGANMTGQFPEGIQHLSMLTHLDLSYGLLTGSVPSALQKLSNLEYLDLSLHMLEGPFPSSLATLSDLSFLNLAYNQFSQSLPSSFPNSLTGLFFHNNFLTGAIPERIGDLSLLKDLRFDFNHLNATLPSTIGQLTGLQSFAATGNNLHGPIPTEIGQLLQLESFFADDNMLSGSLPDELFTLMYLSYLCISNADLTGTLSTMIGQMNSLAFLELDSNNLSGPIPSELGGRALLLSVKLANNRLTGTIPAALCGTRRDPVSADCNPTLSGNGTSRVYCPPGCCLCYPLF